MPNKNKIAEIHQTKPATSPSDSAQYEPSSSSEISIYQLNTIARSDDASDGEDDSISDLELHSDSQEEDHEFISKMPFSSHEFPYRYLILAGGGAKGAIFPGALQALTHAGILQQMNTVVGSSAGALTALMLAIGLSIDDISEQFRKNSFSDFLKKTKLLDGGLFSINSLKRYINKVIYQHLSSKLERLFQKHVDTLDNKDKRFVRNLLGQLSAGTPDYFPYPTFNDLARISEIFEGLDAAEPYPFKQLIVTMTEYVPDCPAGQTVYCKAHDERFGTLPISIAVIASACLPGIFPPVLIGSYHYRDGGIYANSPIDAIPESEHHRALMLVFEDDELTHEKNIFSSSDPELAETSLGDKIIEIGFGANLPRHRYQDATTSRKHAIRIIRLIVPSGLSTTTTTLTTELNMWATVNGYMSVMSRLHAFYISKTTATTLPFAYVGKRLAAGLLFDALQVQQRLSRELFILQNLIELLDKALHKIALGSSDIAEIPNDEALLRLNRIVTPLLQAAITFDIKKASRAVIAINRFIDNTLKFSTEIFIPCKAKLTFAMFDLELKYNKTKSDIDINLSEIFNIYSAMMYHDEYVIFFMSYKIIKWNEIVKNSDFAYAEIMKKLIYDIYNLLRHEQNAKIFAKYADYLDELIYVTSNKDKAAQLAVEAMYMNLLNIFYDICAPIALCDHLECILQLIKLRKKAAALLDSNNGSLALQTLKDVETIINDTYQFDFNMKKIKIILSELEKMFDEHLNASTVLIVDDGSSTDSDADDNAYRQEVGKNASYFFYTNTRSQEGTPSISKAKDLSAHTSPAKAAIYLLDGFDSEEDIPDRGFHS